MVIVTALIAAFFALLIFGFAQALHEPRMNGAPSLAVGAPQGPPVEKPGPETPGEKPGPQGPPADNPGPGIETCPHTIPQCQQGT